MAEWYIKQGVWVGKQFGMEEIILDKKLPVVFTL